MVPASPDLLGWFAHELSLTFLEEARDGTVRLLAGSVAGIDRPMAAILAELAACDEEEVRDLVEAARAGARGALELTAGGHPGVLLVWSEAEGCVRAIYSSRAGASALARRAAAADLAASVTHDVANALTAISGWTRMASASEGLPERTRQALEVVQRSARQALGSARGLLRTMRDAGRPYIAPSAPDRADAAVIIREVVETLHPMLEENGIELVTELPETVWGTMPPATLRLVVSNLVRNAFEALDGGGTIRVTVDLGDGDYSLSVTDDGPGMSEETLARAYDRYFTTKATGTGLGLAMVRDTVREAGGDIEVRSVLGQGTRFEVRLPLARAARRRTTTTRATSGVHAKPALLDRTVLVVDDDAAMRSMVRTALELEGARVTDAAGREEALAAPEPRYDVALVDLSLGGDRGDELIDELKRLGRVTFAILMTGSASLELSGAQAPDAVLRKPFELDELHRTIGRLLAPDDVGAEGGPSREERDPRPGPRDRGPKLEGPGPARTETADAYDPPHLVRDRAAVLVAKLDPQRVVGDGAQSVATTRLEDEVE